MFGRSDYDFENLPILNCRFDEIIDSTACPLARVAATVLTHATLQTPQCHSGAGNNHFTPAREACDDRANSIVASITGALGFRDGQLHKLLFRFVGSRDHVDPKLTRAKSILTVLSAVYSVGDPS
jgi:hypothetical protein